MGCLAAGTLYIRPLANKGMLPFQGSVRCRRMQTHVKSPLEVHALLSGDEGDSTIGCLAAGTLASDHALANMPSRGGRHREGT